MVPAFSSIMGGTESACPRAAHIRIHTHTHTHTHASQNGKTLTMKTDMSDKARADLELIQRSFRLEGDKVIRISTGKEVTASRDNRGYFVVRAGSRKDGTRRQLKLHRVVCALAHARLPPQVDHIDGDKSNNTIANLREATPSQNKANSSYLGMRLPKSGLRNVIELPNGKFAARVQIEGRRKWLGRFDTPEEAKAAETAFRQEHHGEFSRAYNRTRKTAPRVNAVKKATRTKQSAQRAVASKVKDRTSSRRRNGMWMPSDDATAKAFLQEIRLANPLFANASDEELRAIIDLMP